MPNAENTRYTDEELEEFRQLILTKIEKAQNEIDALKANLNNAHGNGDSDTAPTFKVLEEGAATLNQEETIRNVQRQIDFIKKLKDALKRIDNKTYGISRISGKLIPAERLRAVPHATTTVEDKEGKR
ncbi:MAG: TraR/DksA family transcriptional regulator [Paludibacteraceae bacterium]|jgi:RNA polymerase-binding transcription factor DksA|nr:TraR/DksA family transcriptional regulator [Paludibacteraceae bacterium]